MSDGVSKDDLRWAAGYFDARGTIFFYDTHVKVTVQDRHLDVLSRFAWITDLAEPGLVLGSVRIDISARHVVKRILTQLRPYLTGEELLGNIERALKWIEHKDGTVRAGAKRG